MSEEKKAAAVAALKELIGVDLSPEGAEKVSIYAAGVADGEKPRKEKDDAESKNADTAGTESD